MNDVVSIREILTMQQEFDGWLYLPDEPWSLDTQGVFVKTDKNAPPGSDTHIPVIVKRQNWKVTLDSETIEDIIFNATNQLGAPSIDNLFEAFVFYFKNDAFIAF